MPAAATDLTTVALVQAQASIDAGTEDFVQSLITGLSEFLRNETGRDALNAVATFTHLLDGSGSETQFLPESPIVSVSSLTISGAQVSPTDALAQQRGYFIDGTMLVYIGGIFCRGRRNVVVTYQAGYTSTPPDLEKMATALVIQEYVRKDSVDRKMKTTSNVGEVVTYRDWSITPMMERVLDIYSRNTY